MSVQYIDCPWHTNSHVRHPPPNGCPSNTSTCIVFVFRHAFTLSRISQEEVQIYLPKMLSSFKIVLNMLHYVHSWPPSFIEGDKNSWFKVAFLLTTTAILALQCYNNILTKHSVQYTCTCSCPMLVNASIVNDITPLLIIWSCCTLG